jgi:hypothetical protein
VVLLAEHHRALDLVRGEIAAAPDHVAITPAGESMLDAATTFCLTLTRGSVDLFESGDGESAFAQPRFLSRRNIGIDRDLAGPRVLTVTDDHDAVPGSERGQAPAIESFDSDVKQAHRMQTMLRASDLSLRRRLPGDSRLAPEA